MKRIGIVLVALVLIRWPGTVLAQPSTPPPQGPQKVQITTRLVAQFSQMENQWMQAVQRKKTDQLAQFLDDDFQVWTPSIAGPTAREVWQQEALARTLESVHIRQMGVRSVNDENAVVSFIVDESVQSAGKTAMEEYFVVDLWSKRADHWLCTDRYVSQVAGDGVAAEDRKPSGKQ